jgi:hypothetical protein
MVTVFHGKVNVKPLHYLKLLLILTFCILFQGCGSGGDAALPSTESTSETVTIASWNILNLGDSTDVSLRAKVIANFDIVALQEVESLTAMARLEYILKSLP